MNWYSIKDYNYPMINTYCLCKCDVDSGVWYDVFKYTSNENPWLSEETNTYYDTDIVDNWIPVSSIESAISSNELKYLKLNL